VDGEAAVLRTCVEDLGYVLHCFLSGGLEGDWRGSVVFTHTGWGMRRQ
jgi:hypothetical protein